MSKKSQEKSPSEKLESNLSQGDVSPLKQLNELEREIVCEAKKIAKNEVSSCYDLVEKTRELIKLESVL